jgi:hypothetical protein
VKRHLPLIIVATLTALLGVWLAYIEFRVFTLEQELTAVVYPTQKRVRILEGDLREHRLRKDIHQYTDRHDGEKDAEAK